MLKIILWLAVFCILWNPVMTTESSKDENRQSITKEYMMEHCGLTEDDFQGVDFDDFVIRYNLTPETLEEFDGASLLALYKEQTAAYTDYTEIYRQASGKLREEDIDHIAAVIMQTCQGLENEWIVADLEKAVVYGGLGYEPNYGRGEPVLKLTEDDFAFIRETVQASGITGWENTWTGEGEAEFDNNISWEIGIRLDNGECMKYEGDGIVDNCPEEPYRLCETLWIRYVRPSL